MASGSIGHVPASTFAEYVDDPFLDQRRHEVGSSQAFDQDGGDFERDVPSTQVSEWALAHPPAPPARCIAVRPALTHRLYSHHLHVRAKAKLQRDRLLSGPMIDIYVGESKRHWALHRNLLCHHSEALENELLGNAKGSASKDRLDLLDYDPAGFELLVKWLYQGSLDDVSDMVDPNQKYDYAVSCHKLYLLCERFEMAQLKNVAMDQYRKGLNEAELVPDADEIDDIYRKSPKGSPFRLLMTRIAARQIMDPGNERDVETYRECFDNNPDFAIDLVKAIRSGTGGMLFEDPTDKGNACAYHDHEAGPNCYTKGKLKGKQAKKRAGPSSAKSVPYISSGQQSRPPRPHPPMNPRPPPPPSARPSERNTLHRRLTSPASSTVGTSTEMAVATQPPNPDAVRHREKDREKLRKVTSPEKRRPERSQTNGTEKQDPHSALDERHRSSEDAPHPLKDSEAVDGLEGEGEGGPVQALQPSPSRRGIWEWAKVGTGRLNMIGRIPHPEWKGPAAPREITTNGESQIVTIPETQDDFGVPSTTATETNDLQKHENALASKIEGYGLFNAPVTSSPLFAQTKRSSDELVAASSTASTPADLRLITGQWTNGKFHALQFVSKNCSPITPETPTPLQRRRDTLVEIRDSPTDSATDGGSRVGDVSPSNGKLADFTTSAGSTPDPNQVRKYRIALAPNLRPPARSSSNSTK